MTTPAELFTRAARALWGEQFVAGAATALGNDRHTIQKWASGASRIPAGVWRELCPMLSARHSETIAVMRAVSDAGLLGDNEKRPPAG